MKVLIREKVEADLDDIFSWIAKDKPGAAANVIRRLRERIGRLATPGLSHIGRPGLDPGTRELVEPPYIIVYEVYEERQEIEVLYIVHGARRRSGENDR